MLRKWRAIPLRGRKARLGALPMLALGLVFAGAGLWFTTTALLGTLRVKGGASSATAAVSTGRGWLDRISSSLGSLTAKPAPAAGQATQPATQGLMANAGIRDLTEREFQGFTASQDKLSVVLYYTDEDGPSRLMQEQLDALGSEFAGRVEIGRINIDRCPVLASQQDVRTVPDVRFFRNGKRVEPGGGAGPGQRAAGALPTTRPTSSSSGDGRLGTHRDGNRVLRDRVDHPHEEGLDARRDGTALRLPSLVVFGEKGPPSAKEQNPMAARRRPSSKCESGRFNIGRAGP
ncbi:MAG: thioredoxin domain-containing protein [Luteolibacter sp.]